MNLFSKVERCRYDSNKILTIHSRKAVRQVLDIVGKTFRFKPILHWFTGSKEELKEAIEVGFYISVNGAMIASSKFNSFLPYIPKERLLLETDYPFTYGQGNHSETLGNIKMQLEGLRDELSLWNNFKKVLE